MKRRFRLTRSTDFQRVRRLGRSYAHPLMVLIALPNQGENLRIGVAAGKAVGKAVQRNRAKRLIRHAASSLTPLMEPGWDILLIARKSMPETNLEQTQSTLLSLLLRAGLVKQTHEA